MLNVLVYGAGTNSAGLAVLLAERGIRPDLIIFADTGGEKPNTYQHIDDMQVWLQSVGFPPITITKASNPSRKGNLENYCLAHKKLPGLAYGYKSCSMQFKLEPVDDYLKLTYPDQWDAGAITKIVGIDADEAHRAKESPKRNYRNWYPLVEWDVGRDDCISAIDRAGIPQPGKSACFFCPSMKEHEIVALMEKYPELAERALRIESNADLHTVKGLGRYFSWANVIKYHKDQIDLFVDDPPDITCECHDG